MGVISWISMHGTVLLCVICVSVCELYTLTELSHLVLLGVAGKRTKEEQGWYCQRVQIWSVNPGTIWANTKKIILECLSPFYKNIFCIIIFCQVYNEHCGRLATVTFDYEVNFMKLYLSRHHILFKP